MATSSPAPVTSRPPAITHVLETCLMVKDVRAATDFYKDVMGLEPYMDTPRMSGFALGQTTLLLFQLGGTIEDTQMPDNRGTIPGHGPSQDILNLLLPSAKSGTTTPASKGTPSGLNIHFCLAVPNPEDVQAWEKWFIGKNVKIIGKVDWPRGGKSVYFADVDGNVGEVASRGLWEHY